MAACRYEISLFVFNLISHSFAAARTREISTEVEHSNSNSISRFTHVLSSMFLLVVWILNHPTGSSKYSTTRKNIQRYYTPKHLILVYTTQVNSTFPARWLASLEVISQVLFTSEQLKKTKWLLSLFFSNKVTVLAASYSACVVYTKTIIHLSVNESGGYLPRRFAARQISTTIHLHFGE